MTSINLINFETSKVIDISCMFSECQSLSLINLGWVNLNNTKSYFGLFDGVSKNGEIIYSPKLIRQEIKNLFPANWKITEIDDKDKIN